jgi:hypothetical protein
MNYYARNPCLKRVTRVVYCTATTQEFPMSQSLIRLPEAAAVSEQVSSVLGAVSAVLSAGIFYVAFAIAL